MKNQYIGDIGDYGKYGLLRFLASQGIRIGVNWYLTEDDGSTDGRFTNYLKVKNTPDRKCDPELFNRLSKIAFRRKKSVQMLEDTEIIPEAKFYNEYLRSSALEPVERKEYRQLWFDNSMFLTQHTDLIFADPDNGISYQIDAKTKNSEKFILPDEVLRYYETGVNVVYYCHKGRRKAEDWEREKIRIKEKLPEAKLLAVTFHRGTQRSYIFVLHPEDYPRYKQILTDFLESSWKNMFTWENTDGIPTLLPYPAENKAMVTLEFLEEAFTVCKVKDYYGVDLEQPFVFTGTTDQEKSLVCPIHLIPENTTDREDGWKAFRVSGELDFSLIGILAGITKVLAVKQIGVFVISTYNTDYMLVKEAVFEKAILALKEAGYKIVGITI